MARATIKTVWNEKRFLDRIKKGEFESKTYRGKLVVDEETISRLVKEIKDKRDKAFLIKQLVDDKGKKLDSAKKWVYRNRKKGLGIEKNKGKTYILRKGT